MHRMTESYSIRTSVVMSDNVQQDLISSDVDLISPNVDLISLNIVELGVLDVNRRGHG